MEVPDCVAVALPVGRPVRAAEALPVRVARELSVGREDVVEVPLPLAQEEARLLPEAVPVAVLLRVPRGETLAIDERVAVPLGVLLPVPLLAPDGEGAEETVAVLKLLPVPLAVDEVAPLAVAVLDRVAPELAVGPADLEAVPVPELLPVLQDVTIAVDEAVAVPLIVRCDTLATADPELVPLAVPLTMLLLVPVKEVTDNREAVLLAVCDPVAVPVVAVEPLAVPLAVATLLLLPVADTTDEPVPLAVCDTADEPVPLAVCDPVAVPLVAVEPLAVPLAVATTENECVTEPLPEDEGDDDAEMDGGSYDAVRDGSVNVAKDEKECVTEPLPEAEGEDDAEIEGGSYDAVRDGSVNVAKDENESETEGLELPLLQGVVV